MMDNWGNAAPSLRAAAAVNVGSNGSLNSAAGTANSPLFAAQLQQRQLAFEQAARLALPKPSMPSSLGNYGGLLGAAPPSNNHGANTTPCSSATNLRMLRDALLLQDAVNSKRGDNSGFDLLQLQQHQRELVSGAVMSSSPKSDILPGPSLFAQSLRGKKQRPPSSINTAAEGPLKKKLKTGAGVAAEQQEGNLESSAGTTGTSVFVETTAEIKSSFPLPSTTEQKRKKKIVLKQLRAKWDRLECESDAVEHDTDAAQEALVKECFLRSLHRYNSEHLRQRIHKHNQKSKRHIPASPV